MAWIKSNQKHLTAFCKICSSETTVNFAERWLFFSLNRQLLLSAKEQVIWLMIIFISLKGSFPTIGVKSLSRFLRAGFLNSILTSHPVSGGGSLPPSISSGRYSSIFPPHWFFSSPSEPSLHSSQGNKIDTVYTGRSDVLSDKKSNRKEVEKRSYSSRSSYFLESV